MITSAIHLMEDESNGSYIAADRSYTTHWKVFTDGADKDTITSHDVEFYSGLPAYGDLYGSSGAQLLKKRVRQDRTNFSCYMVTCEYGYQTVDKQDSGSGAVNPEQRPAERRWFTTEIQEPIEGDPDKKNSPGGVFVMPNGRPFPQPPMRSVYLPTLQVTRWEGLFQGQTAAQVIGAVNASQFAGYPKHTVLCTRLEARDEVWQNGLSVNTSSQVTYQFTYNRRKWTPGRYLARDFFERGPAGVLRPIVVNGAIVSNPWPLDVYGKALKPDDIQSGYSIEHIGSDRGYYYVEIDLHHELELNLLGLPL